MTDSYSDYLPRSQRLVNAAQRFKDSLTGDASARRFAVDRLLAATGQDFIETVTFGYEEGATSSSIPEATDHGEAFAAALLDVQSANILITAGTALNELGASARDASLDEALQHVSTTRAQLSEPPKESGFEMTPGIESATLGDATKSFERRSGIALDGIVDDAAKTVGGAAAKLVKLDPKIVLEGLGKLGGAFEIGETAGRLIQRGIEKLKRALEAISNLFGDKALAAIKQNISEIWEDFKAGRFTKAILARLFGVAEVEAHIKEILGRPDTSKDRTDAASNALAPLAEDYTRWMKILEALGTGISFAGTALAVFHFAGPWLAMLLAVGYLGVIGGTLLIGIEYTGERGILGWARGVKQISDTLPAS